MRAALNSLQATANGLGDVTAENVFKVCDQPHPVLVESIIKLCVKKQDLNSAHKELKKLLGRGYAPADVIGTFFKVSQSVALFEDEEQQMTCLKIVGETNLRIAEGCGTSLQLAGMLSRLTLASLQRQKELKSAGPAGGPSNPVVL